MRRLIQRQFNTLQGHKNSKITMDIYAKVKYNKPERTYAVVCQAFDSSVS